MQGSNVVGVQFRRAGKIYDFLSEGIELRVGDFVVVHSDRGPSLAEVVRLRFLLPGDQEERKLKPVSRKASVKELGRPNRLDPDFVQDFTLKQVRKHKLKMKILRSEVQLGGSKVIVYFSAPGRVDFRELVKDLAGGLKARIELKQIGARDETKLLGGIGSCGREYCCSSFLREFLPVSIRMAKNQNLALNPGKVSGGCGRLLCCLTYENDTYSALRTRLPARGTRIRILSTGQCGVVIRGDLLNQIVVLKGDEGEQLEVKVTDTEVLEGSVSTADDALAPEDADAMEWAEGLDLAALMDDVSTLDADTSGSSGKKQESFRDDESEKQPDREREQRVSGSQRQSRSPRWKHEKKSHGAENGSARTGKETAQDKRRQGERDQGRDRQRSRDSSSARADRKGPAGSQDRQRRNSRSGRRSGQKPGPSEGS